MQEISKKRAFQGIGLSVAAIAIDGLVLALHRTQSAHAVRVGPSKAVEVNQGSIPRSSITPAAEALRQSTNHAPSNSPATSHVKAEYGGAPNLSLRDIAINFSALAKQARNGDTELAAALYNAVRDCDTAARDEPQLSHRLRVVGEALEGEGHPLVRDRILDGMRKIYDRCRLFSADQIGTEWEWLELSARNGNWKLLDDYYFKGTSKPV